MTHMQLSPRRLRASLQNLAPSARASLLASLPRATAEALVYDWGIWARDAQLPPPGDWIWWLVCAGRGFGKTRTGAEFIRQRVADGARAIALIGPTAADVRDTMVEIGPGSILKNSPPWDRPEYEPSKRRLTWRKTGAVATLFSADEPERLRGPQHDTIWADEIGAWKYQRETWDQATFGFRLGSPRGIITTTPRPTPVMKELLRDPTVQVTRGSTFDNAANLAKPFLARLLKRYEGTRLGRQELYAQLLEDTPGALWTLKLFEGTRVSSTPDLSRVAVAIDPQASDPDEDPDADDAAETGIVAGGVAEDGQGYVLRDASDRYSPGEWGERAVLLHDELQADCIIGEVNNGGAMVGHVVTTAAEKLHREKRRASPRIVFRSVNASRGKHTRAEPIAALFEQQRAHLVGVHAKLEDQASTWVPGQKSPDRMDAMVWLLTHLMLSGTRVEYTDRPRPTFRTRL